MGASEVTEFGGLAFAAVAAGAALAAVRYARITVTESRAGRREADSAHRHALQTELALQRLAQIGKIADGLADLSDIGRDEMVNPPPSTGYGAGRWTRVTGAAGRLEAAVTVLERLGGPELPEARTMLRRVVYAGTSSAAVVDQAMTTLTRATHVLEHDPSLALPVDSHCSDDAKPAEQAA